MIGNPDRADILAVTVLGAVMALAAGAYLARVMVKGPARYDRIDADGGSWLFHKRVMAAGYWAIQPIGRALARSGVRPDHITWASIAVGLAAGAAFQQGRFGLAAGVALVAGLFDALDGMVGRLSGTTSAAGTVLDSAADRYVEFFWLAGLALHFGPEPLMLAVSLAALHGSFMVSYATAKAQGCGVTAPRGIMKRPERVLVLLAGAAISAGAGTDIPLRLSLGAIALLANFSAVRRLGAIRRVLREQDEARAA